MAYYDLRESPLFKDIQKILDKGEDSTYNLKAIVSTPLKDISVKLITEVNITRDYYGSISDTGYVKIKLPKHSFIYDIYPHRNNLEITIEITIFSKGKSIKYSTRYKAISLVDNQTELDKFIPGRKIDKKLLLDLTEMTFQILDRRVEPLRIKTIQGIFRDVTVKDLLKSVISSNANKILVDGKAILNALDIEDPDNKKIYKQIILPSGSYLSELPNYLHNHITGIYSTGLGSYLQTYKDNFTWFIYPLFNTKKTDKEEYTLVIYEVESSALPESEKTFRVEGTNVYILALGDRNVIDTADGSLMNNGSGFRAPAASSFMKKPISIENGKIIGKRSNLNNEIVLEERADGLNYAPTINKSTDNPFILYSENILKTLTRIDLIWSNSNPELLFPGMKCRYMKAIGNDVIEIHGTLIFSNTFIDSLGNSPDFITYRMSTQLTILTEPFKKFEK